MSNGFYKAFEERYYAPRDVIKKMRKQYLAFVVTFKEIYPKGSIIDLGCGRGEWLELMLEMGFDVQGVDIDEGMLADCYERGLLAEKADAVDFIKTLNDDSHIIVSAFHVVEHIPFEGLQVVVAEAFRVLKPGGLLIMETPNPENITVATRNFYLDPTHLRPIPSELLSFLPEYYGFERVKVLRLQESKDLLKKDRQSLYDVITGVSPDYAVVAQKAAPPEVLAKFDQAFDKEYGLALETLTTSYDKSILLSIDRIEAKTAEAEHRAAEVQITLNAVYASFSWRVTWPFRKLLDVIQWTFRKPVFFVSWIAAKAMAFAIKRDPLRLKLLGQVNKYPRLKARLYTFGQERGLFSQSLVPLERTKQELQQQADHAVNLDILTPRGRKIYHDLKKAIEQRQKGND